MNKYDNLNDYELISLLPEDDDTIKNIIYEKYKNLIEYYMLKYRHVIRAYKVDTEELKCEAFYGFSDGINSYRDNMSANLKTFLSLCIDRRMRKYISKYTTTKAKVFQEALSLEDQLMNELDPLQDRISDDNKNNPLENLSQIDFVENVLSLAKEELSDFEYNVFQLMINNNAHEISNILNKTPKQIDNTIQRIKNKMKKVLTDNKLY